ncbi:MAG: hypothetical protein H6825_07710 [Planctomycetes bacterium]|nr:hypothetical protein [Planctomycetota bacterium]
MPARPSSPLARVVQQLEKQHGAFATHEPSDAWGLLLWENVCYLADDARRRAAFELLERETSLEPEAILAAPRRTLLAVTAHGIESERFADKLRECARLALDAFDGDVDAAVLRLPDKDAKKALRKFPGIGEPGAEKILLLADGRPFLAPESNGLRVLQRLGLVVDGAYAQAYRAAREIAAAHLPSDATRLARARSLLRRHGQDVCKNTRPRCDACALATDCAYARAGG